jgi:hypothetical protein
MRAVRSLSVRFQEGDFRVAASRPLLLDPGGSPVALRMLLSGEPLDLVITVPRTATFELRADGRRLVQSSGGRPTTSCTGVAVHEPASGQVWFSFHPQAGRPVCR